MKIVFFTLILAFSTLLSASLVVGTVQKVEGSVKVKSEGSFKKSRNKEGGEVKEGDLITTSRNGKTVIKLMDGSSIVLDVSSSIHFVQNNTIDQKSGKIYYKITSRDAKNSLKIKTPFAIIGIKGTIFVVNSNEGKESVALKEGLIGVASIKEQFSLYRKEVLAKYNAYISDQMAGFKKFKNGGVEPKPEITKEFDLKEGNVISFSDNVVKESSWNEEDDSEFSDFEKMMDSSFTSSSSNMSQEIKQTDEDDDDDDFGEPIKSGDRDIMDDVEDSMKF